MSKSKKNKRRKKFNQIKNIALYFLLIFISNFSSIILIKLADVCIYKAFAGNCLYELSTFLGLYVGIKHLKMWELAIIHIVASTTGYFLAQWVCTII